MAKNYNVFEVVELLVENKDAEALLDVGKRYPLLTQKLLRIAAVAGDALLDFASFLPENLSANKINGLIKKSITAGEDADDEDAEVEVEEDEEEEEKPAKKAGKKPVKEKAKTASKKSEDDADDKDYDSMSNAQMYKLLGDLGLRKECKAKYGDLSHDSMLSFLKGMDGDAAEADDEEDAGTYDEMSVVELYKECKKRGIKAEQKKPSKYYIGLLEKDDAKAAEPEEDESDDDWGDEDEEETKPAKKADKKPVKEKGKPASKKKAPMPEPEDDEDEDDDWDI